MQTGDDVVNNRFQVLMNFCRGCKKLFPLALSAKPLEQGLNLFLFKVPDPNQLRSIDLTENISFLSVK